MPESDLASVIDLTLLRADATPMEAARCCEDAVVHGFHGVCVNGVYLPHVRHALDASQADGAHEVRAISVAGFPLGAVSSMARAMDATQSAKAGAQELDVVPWLPAVLDCDQAGLRDDLLQTTRSVRAVAGSIVVKVILEMGLLARHADDAAQFERMVAVACAAIRESGSDFVSTSTGVLATDGADIDHVRLLSRHASGLGLKAHGDIKSRDHALRLLEAGADRLGTSAGVAVVTQES